MGLNEEKENIIKAVQDFYNKNGKIIIRDMRVTNGLPNTEKMIKLFGTFQNLLMESNIPIPDNKKHNFNRVQLTNEKLLDDLKCFVEEHLKNHLYLPTNNDIDKCKAIQSCSTYIKRFRSFENAYKLIGYDVEKFNNSAMEKDMINKYKIMCDKIGHVLNSREITKLSKLDGTCIYATETYNNHFGSISNLQKLCGFIPTMLGKSITREESICALKRLSEDVGDIPTYEDVFMCEYTPSVRYYINEFGSWNKALKEIGLDIKKGRNYRTKEGEEFLSSYEYKFALVMKKYEIDYDREVLYKNIIHNFDRSFRFDFVLNIFNCKYYIEIFGIEGNDFYDQRKQEKINICKNNNIKLIEIYKNDLYGKTHKQVYDMLINKIYQLESEVA